MEPQRPAPVGALSPNISDSEPVQDSVWICKTETTSICHPVVVNIAAVIKTAEVFLSGAETLEEERKTGRGENEESAAV